MDVIAIVVPSVQGEYRYSVPLDIEDRVSDVLEKFRRISRLDEENYFGLYPEEVLGLLREDYLRYHDLAEQRLRETERAWKYAGKTLVLLYINK